MVRRLVLDAKETACLRDRVSVREDVHRGVLHKRGSGGQYSVPRVRVARSRCRVLVAGARVPGGRLLGSRPLCQGELQCAHIMSRRYRALRWSYDNAVPLCGAHHTFFTHRPAEWEESCRNWGVDWDDLRRRAINDPPMDPVAYLEQEGEAQRV
jgi:hypothetical protein